MSSSVNPEFSKVRALLWPIHRWELKRFLPLLIIYSLICFNYSILRAAKDALVITAPSSGAEALPFIKVWATLPMAIFFTFLFSRLSNKFTVEKIFYYMIGIFLTFFALFAFVLYPNQDILHPHQLADQLQNMLPKGFKGLITLFRNWSFTLFYVMSELWGTMIMTVLFWVFANEITSVKDAKRYYALLGVGANLASILSGQISIFLSKHVLTLSSLLPQETWGLCLKLLITAVFSVGIITVIVFRWYNKKVLNNIFSDSSPHSPKEKVKMSLRKNFAYLAKSKYLICIAIIVITYNFSLNMIEIVWKDQIKQLYPNPTDFNVYMGRIMTIMGALSTIIALFFCGNLIRKSGWTFTALITPTIVLSSGVLFLTFVLLKNHGILSFSMLLGTSPLILSVFLGSMQNCLSRACKYTVFDATKEMSFIPLSTECKMKGKAAIDGVGSRLGKSGGSIVHQLLLVIFGSVSASAPYVAALFLVVILGWISATFSLGRQFNSLAETEPSLPEDAPAPVEETKQEVLT